jgi:hypothetical protein
VDKLRIVKSSSPDRRIMNFKYGLLQFSFLICLDINVLRIQVQLKEPLRVWEVHTGDGGIPTWVYTISSVLRANS